MNLKKKKATTTHKPFYLYFSGAISEAGNKTIIIKDAGKAIIYEIIRVYRVMCQKQWTKIK